MPFVAVRQPDGKVGAGAGEMERGEALLVQPGRTPVQIGIVLFQAAIGSPTSTREAAKMAFASFSTATASGSSGNICFAQEGFG